MFTKSRASTMITTTPLATYHQRRSFGRSGLVVPFRLPDFRWNTTITAMTRFEFVQGLPFDCFSRHLFTDGRRRSQVRKMSTALAKVNWGSNNNFSRVLLWAMPMAIWSRIMESRWASYSQVAIRDWSSNKQVMHDSPSRWWRVKN